MDAEQPRRSRFGWPSRTEATTTPAGTHDHGMPPAPLGTIYLALVIIMLILVGIVWFLLARGASRDARDREVQKEIRDSWCQALDAFPEDNAFLDPLRDYYDCGPGLPKGSLTPEQRMQLGPQATGTPAPTIAPLAPAPSASSSTPDPYRPRTPTVGPPRPTLPAQPTPTPTTALTATPSPAVDLSPVTDPLCNALSLCF